MKNLIRAATLALFLPGAAALADQVPAGAQRGSAGSMGGGFIEFLFTGGASGNDVAEPARMAPRVVRGGYGMAPAIEPQAPVQQLASVARPERPKFDPRFERQEVSYDGPERPGTIVIDTNERFLYLVQANGSAMRYGVGVGRPGFEWSGKHTITRKAEWPDWRPPEEMLKRRPDLPAFMEGGPRNPLGARAMYLGNSLYRIHGSNEPWSIGQAVSSGCIRMRNEDVIDLYDRVKVGTTVIVM